MTGRTIVVTMIVALISSGVWPFLQALLKRRPEAKQLDAQTTSITIQGAETTVTVLMKSLERAEHRESVLEQRLTDREAKIDELEARLDTMSDNLYRVQRELTDARRQLGEMREDGKTKH